MQAPLEFGWYLPTSGDTTCYGDNTKSVAPSAAMFDRVVLAAEAAGFEFFLVPVASACWEAWISSAMAVAKTKRIKALVAARPGYISPVQLAKMGATFDQLSGGRLAVNLIAGQSDIETEAEGIHLRKEDRYALMEEDVSIMKALWSASGSVDFAGRFHTLKGARISPRPLQQPYPRFYLGGGSADAWDVSAKHADIHLFWGDTPARIAETMATIRRMAARYGRADRIGFGMRLQILCRETEAEAWGRRTRTGARRDRGADAIYPFPLRQLGRQPARAATGAGAWRTDRAASVDRRFARAAGGGHRGGRQSAAMRGGVTGIHRSGLRVVLPVGLSAR